MACFHRYANETLQDNGTQTPVNYNTEMSTNINERRYRVKHRPGTDVTGTELLP